MDFVECSHQELRPKKGEPIKSRIKTAFDVLSEEVRELSLGTTGEVERVKGPLSPVEFLRNCVLPGRPCIITDSLDHWPALQKWSNDYLCTVLKHQTVSVHFTPDGRADALVDPLHMLATYNCPIVAPSYEALSNALENETHNGSNHGHEAERVARVSLKSSEALSNALEKETHNGGNHGHEAEGVAKVSVESTDFQTLEVRKFSSVSLCETRETLCGPSEAGTSDNTELQARTSDSTELLFVRAHVEKLPFPQALEVILNGSGGAGEIERGVAYAQEQNGCFLSEYGELTGDAEVHIPWATEALGCMPEAVNLWIGKENAVTSFHKDHYENLYAVVAGAKHFTLLPPVDVHRMYIRAYPSAQYVRMKNSRSFGIVLDEQPSMVPWVSVDPYPADGEAREILFPRYFNGSLPFTCTVQAGEILYLPSMWFHHVRQTPDSEGRTIALNFWYDMQFDIKYAYFNMMQALL